MSFPDALEIVPLSKPPSTTVRVPGSKSITNRALVLAALSQLKGFTWCLTGALQSEDTEVMIECLAALGIPGALTEWPDATVYVNSGER